MNRAGFPPSYYEQGEKKEDGSKQLRQTKKVKIKSLDIYRRLICKSVNKRIPQGGPLDLHIDIPPQRQTKAHRKGDNETGPFYITPAPRV